MNHEQREATPGRSPEQGGTSADELAYRLHQQELLAGFGVLALRTPDFMDLLQEATRLCAQGLHIRYCKAMEYLPDEDRFVVRAGVGWKPGTIGSMTGADLDSPTGYAFRRGEPVISSHLGDESHFRTPRMLAEHGIRRAINVPVATETSRYGVLEADSPAEGRFTEADLAFMQGFANLLGVALERRKTEEELRLAHARNEETLESISDAFYAVDRDWRFTYVNRRAAEWWRRRREDLIGKVYWDEFPEAVGSEAYEAHQLARKEQRTVHLETVSPILGHWVDVDIHPTAGGGCPCTSRMPPNGSGARWRCARPRNATGWRLRPLTTRSGTGISRATAFYGTRRLLRSSATGTGKPWVPGGSTTFIPMTASGS